MLAPMPRAVRRRPGAGPSRLAVLTLVLAGVASGCGGVGQPATYDATGVDGLQVPTPAPDPQDFVDGVDNPWLALEAVGRWRYRIEEDGARVGSLEVETLGGTVEVAGLQATGVRSVMMTGEEGAEVSVVTRYYAQDEAGNVWLVGESSAGGRSWRAGTGGAEAGLAMPAEPRVGDGWVRADVPGPPEQTVRVTDPPAVLPAGSSDAVWTTETAQSETAQTETAQTSPRQASSRRAYVAGRGLVHAEDLGTGRTLELAESAGD